MLRRLVAAALSLRLGVLALAAVIAIAGMFAYRALPIDAYPDIAPVQVQLVMKAPGMTPAEVETRVVTPIETAMLGIPNQQVLRSTSKYGLSTITIEFKDGVDIYWARQQVAERLNATQADLPQGVTGGGSRRSRRRSATSTCSPSKGRSRSPPSARSSTGRCGRRCGPYPAWPT